MPIGSALDKQEIRRKKVLVPYRHLQMPDMLEGKCVQGSST
jgi:hypothetical protein